MRQHLVIISKSNVDYQMANANKKRKMNDKDLEQELIAILSQTSTDVSQSTDRLTAISAYLLLKAGRRVEHSALLLLILTIVLASSMLIVVLILAYTLGLFTI